MALTAVEEHGEEEIKPTTSDAGNQQTANNEETNQRNGSDYVQLYSAHTSEVNFDQGPAASFLSSLAETTCSYHPVTHIIFDLDGLLLDTETLYRKATDVVTRKYAGRPFDVDAQKKVLGLPPAENARIIIQDYGLEHSVEDYLTETNQIFSDMIHGMDLMPGAMELIEHFHKHSIPKAIATGSTQRGWEIKSSAFPHIFGPDSEYFEHVVIAGEPSFNIKPKPHPEPFILAAEKFKTKPPSHKHVLVFEDSPVGVQAAVAAGMQVVMVPDANHGYVHETLKEQLNPTHIVPSLAHFDPTLFGLPPL